MNILNDVDTRVTSPQEEEHLQLGKSGCSPQIDVHLQKIATSLKADFLSEDGKSIDYRALKSSDVFQNLRKDTFILNHVSLDEMSQNRLKAFFINVYNVLTIHGIASADPLPKTVIDISNFWRTTAYSIGGAIYSLDDIEHGILRGNKRHPASLSPQFTEGDPRKQYSMEVLDPRIHFALNCGAKSCPAIRFYTEENVEESLEKAARSFLKTEVQISGNKVKLSKLLQWYGSDFGETPKDILKWIHPYLPNDMQEQLDALLKTEKFKINYDDYDWSLNVA